MAWQSFNDVYIPKSGGGDIEGSLSVSGNLVVNDGSGNGTTYDVASEISDLKSAWDSVSHVTPPALTRHYKMDDTISIPWDSGTLVCDMNEDGSVFRLHGNAYKSSATAAWKAANWIPGTNKTYVGYKTFKVKAPADGKPKWIDCAGIHVNINDSLIVGNLNYDHMCIGTDGYIYICTWRSDPKNTSPVIVFYSGITCYVDSETNSGGYVCGSGA